MLYLTWSGNLKCPNISVVLPLWSSSELMVWRISQCCPSFPSGWIFLVIVPLLHPLFLFIFLLLGFLFIYLSGASWPRLVSCLTFITKGNLADIHLFHSHTHWANLCFWQRGLGSDIYSCRFLREWCVTEVANDAWYIFICTSIHEESGRWYPFHHRKKACFC